MKVGTAVIRMEAGAGIEEAIVERIYSEKWMKVVTKGGVAEWVRCSEWKET